jgi:transposase InsO family protein
MRQREICKHQVCNHCGGRFGMVTHRWWGNKFCKSGVRPGSGQIAGWELTGTCRAFKDGSHGQAPHLQHRIQASGRPGIHCGRDPACAGEAPRPVPQSYPHLGREVRSWRLLFPDLARSRMVDGPNRLWVADITYIAIDAGFVYLAAILDAWSRRVVGYAISRSIDARLAIAALKAAIRARSLRHGRRDHSRAISMSSRLLAEKGWWKSSLHRPRRAVQKSSAGDEPLLAL